MAEQDKKFERQFINVDGVRRTKAGQIQINAYDPESKKRVTLVVDPTVIDKALKTNEYQKVEYTGPKKGEKATSGLDFD